ncbi:hypothetical protein [Microcoleus vaginatus]
METRRLHDETAHHQPPHSLAKLIEWKLKKAAKVSILTAFNFPIH